MKNIIDTEQTSVMEELSNFWIFDLDTGRMLDIDGEGEYCDIGKKGNSDSLGKMLLNFITAEQNGQQKYEPNEKAKNHSTLKLEVVAKYEMVGDRNLVFAFAKNKKDEEGEQCNSFKESEERLRIINNRLLEALEKETNRRSNKELALASIFEIISAGIAILDEKGYVIDINERLLTRFELGEKENIVETHFSQRLYPEEKREEIDNILNAVLRECDLGCGSVGEEKCEHSSPNRIQQEFSYTTKNGDTIETLLSVVCFKNRELQTNFILSITDISAIKELERKQKESEKLLLAQSRMADMGEMIGAIAHQWRQPLNTLGLLIQDVPYCVKNNEMNIEYANEFNKNAMEQISFMSNTIDDFRNFFKIDKQLVSFSLAEQVKNTLSLVQDMYKTHAISIITVEKSAPIVIGYPNELSQAVLNIVSNAKDAFEELNTKQRRIVVTISETEKFGKLVIEDNAGGISKEVIDRVFEPYFTTKPEGKGTGIGLYMSKTIIETNMKGRLTVHNKDDGAVFTIKVPK